MGKGGGPPPSTFTGPQLEDQKLTVSTYGTMIPLCFGATRLSGNLIWTTGIEEVEVKKITKTKTGKGKGGSQVSTNISYEYYATFAQGLTEGVSDGAVKVFVDNQLALDLTGKSPFQKKDHEFAWYDGAPDQPQAPEIVADQGDDAPAFRNLAYIMTLDLPLKTYGNRIPQVQVIASCSQDGLAPFDELNFTATPTGGADFLVYDHRDGYVYSIAGTTLGPSTISKIDITDGTEVFTKTIVDEDGNNVTLSDASGQGYEHAVSPVDGMIYVGILGTVGGASPWLLKLDPNTGTIVDRLQVPGTNPITSLALFGLIHPIFGIPVECWVLHTNAANDRLCFGFTGSQIVVGTEDVLPAFSRASKPYIDTFDPLTGYTFSTDYVLSDYMAAGDVDSFIADASLNALWCMASNDVILSIAPITKLTMQMNVSLLGVALGGDGAPSIEIVDHTIFRIDGDSDLQPYAAGHVDANPPLATGTISGTYSQLTGTSTRVRVRYSELDPVSLGVRPGMYIVNLTDGSNAIITEIDGVTNDVPPPSSGFGIVNIVHEALSGGTTNRWDESDEWAIERRINFGNGGFMGFCGLDNTLIGTNNRSGDEWSLWKFDIATEQIIDVRYDENYEFGTCLDPISLPEGDDGDRVTAGAEPTFHFWDLYQSVGLTEGWIAVGDGNIIKMDPVTLEIDRLQNASDFPDFSGTGSDPYIYLRDLNAIYTDDGAGSNGGGQILYLHRADGSPEDLDIVVTKLCRRAGLLDHQIDVTDLAGEQVRGYLISKQSEVKANIQPLILAYDFSSVETDWTLKFVKRTLTPTSINILEEDMGVDDQRGKDEVVVPTREQEVEKVLQLYIEYAALDRDHLTSTQTAKRIREPFESSYASSQSKIQIPIVFTADEASTIARRVLGRLWTERTNVEIQLPQKYLDLDPLDIVDFTADGTDYDLNLLQSSVGAGFSTKTRGVNDDASIVNPDGWGDEGIFTSQVIPLLLASRIVALDVPLLRDIDDAGLTSYVIYAGFTYPRTGFPGALALIGPSVDQLVPWFSDRGALDWGRATTLLGDVALSSNVNYGSAQTLDETNSVTVYMVENTIGLSSATDYEGFLNGDPTTGGVKGILGMEVIQAMTVVDNMDGTYTLSDLLRGRRGTEFGTSRHRIGEQFIPLTEDQPLQTFSFPADSAGVPVTVRATTRGDIWGQETERTLLWQGNSLRPLAPVQVEGEYDASDNLIVRWIRRNRLRGEDGWGDGFSGEIILSEETEAYQVHLMEKGADPLDTNTWTSSAVKNVIAGSQPDRAGTLSFDVTYPAATAAITDVGGGGLNFASFRQGAWCECSGFDQADKNSFFVSNIDGTASTATIRIPTGLTDDLSNAAGRIRQLPTWAEFTDEELITAGYNGGSDTSDPPFVVVYQVSVAAGNGFPGFDPLGIARG